jgi:hypothetical protein
MNGYNAWIKTVLTDLTRLAADRRVIVNELRSISDDWDSPMSPIIIIVFLLCGGTNIFGGGCKDDSCDNGFGGSWLLILLVIFLFLGNQRDGKGFLGGIF